MMPEAVMVVIEALAFFDWYYEMSDDHSVWRAGEAKKSRVIGFIMALDPTDLEIFATWWEQNIGENPGNFKSWVLNAIDNQRRQFARKEM